MGFLIALLTFVLVLDCIVLIFLVLIQLPKKEAGAGLAFGGAASDALFGAGSGTVLTKITKYVAGFFFALAVILTLLQHSYVRSGSRFEQRLSQPASAPATLPPTAATPAPAPSANKPAAAVQGTNLLMSAPAASATGPTIVPEQPAVTSSNPPPAAPVKQ